MEDEAVQTEPLTKQDFEALARFRFGLRTYLRFSEEAVRSAGLTPQQYQLLLALKGFPGRDWASVRELADRLLLRHHSVVELISRAQKQDLVHRGAHPSDGRAVRVMLTPQGERVLARLVALHRDELRRMDTAILPPVWDSAPQPDAPSPHDATRNGAVPPHHRGDLGGELI
ncbi:MarR family winged helix-turn-helix transcriptional regulator [Nonomuraea sp. NPDC026600]|uniref:MarR family winged helix-turn-helix transcriptional regulator n=1 Tax=Nonomuraea sp. NPDC026600 TaxID=3155363 RepID=UPI0033C513F9